MRKILLLLVTCLFISVGVQAQVPLLGISLDYDDVIILKAGEDTTLVVTFNPTGTTDKVVSWKIENADPDVIETIATIDTTTTVDKTTCIITGVSEGEIIVTVKGASGSLTATCKISVVMPVIGMVLNENTKNMIIGQDTVLIARINPPNATNSSIKWHSLDSSIVNIESTVTNRFDTICKIVAIKPGTTWIVAETDDGDIEDRCEVTVNSATFTSFTLNHDSIELLKGDEATIIAQIRPLEGTYKFIKWENTNFPAENIIEIIPPSPGMLNDTICRIRATGFGEAKIIAESFDGSLDTCVVTVKTHADSVVMNYKTLTLDLYTDSAETLIGRIFPSVSISKKLTWSTSDDKLVKIDSIKNDSLCYIKALRSGTAIIYAVTDNNKKDSCIVTVSPRLVDSLKIDKSLITGDTLTLISKNLFELSVTVFPWNATNDTVVFSSTNLEVARIDTIANALHIRALNSGTAIVYARAKDGNGAMDSVIVKVNTVPVTALTLSADTIKLYKQSEGKVIAKFSPANATNDSVVWSTSDNSIIRIETSTGNDTICTFTAIGEGMALIYAKSKENSDIKDSCVVVVRENYVFVKSNTTTVDGIIELSIVIPSGVAFTDASFKLNLPKGFGLTWAGTEYKTSLTVDAKTFADLQISYINDSTYIFNITPKSSLISNIPNTGVPLKIMDIYYTIYENSLEGNNDIYNANFVDIMINLISGSIVNDDQAVQIKVYKDATGNEVIKEQSVLAYFSDNRLYVNSDKAETVYVYSMNGSLVYMKNKAEGPAVFDINTKETILIVRGSSGWVIKAVNK